MGTRFPSSISSGCRTYSRVDLLTLSACETAAQQAGSNSREVDGFAELAQGLGASSVIATLWRVSDEETSKLMTELCRLRQRNPNTPKSEGLATRTAILVV